MVMVRRTERRSSRKIRPPGGQEENNQGSRKSLAALALLADKLKSHGQITYILSRLCTETVGKGI